jgi:glutamate 5-kinase
MAYIQDLSSQITALKQSGLEALLVTSGAIGMGAGEMGISEKITSIPKRQACAAIGQPLLMHAYKKAFSEAGQVIAQVLLTSDVLSQRQTYLNLRNSVETLLSMGVIPVFNENDNLSTAEIGNAFGDNDRLSALVASKVDADLLVLLTDIDALYDKNPREHDDAQPIRFVEGVSVEHLAMAGNKSQGFSTGGMRSKLEAVRIAEGAGCDVVLAQGREKNILQKIIDGEEVGTLFHPLKKLRNKERWLLHADPQGSLTVDDGALEALRSKGKSLLPKGVKAVTGQFAPGDVVQVNQHFKILTRLSSEEIRAVMGRSSSEMQEILGRKDVIARPEEMIATESQP